jgi:hypothetical protein
MPYQRRRAALEALFADRGLEAPLTLCPSTTKDMVPQQLELTDGSVEDGIRFLQPFRPAP